MLLCMILCHLIFSTCHGQEPAKQKQGFQLAAGYSRIPVQKSTVFINVDARLSFQVSPVFRLGPIAQAALGYDKETKASILKGGGGFIRAAGKKIFGEISSTWLAKRQQGRLLSRFAIGTTRPFTQNWYFEPQVFIQSELVNTNSSNALTLRPGIQVGLYRPFNREK